MPAILVRSLDAKTLRRLKERARLNRPSLNTRSSPRGSALQSQEMSDLTPARPRFGVGSVVRPRALRQRPRDGYDGAGYMIHFRGGETRRVAFAFPDLRAESATGDSIQAKDLPLEVFFKKVIGIRDRLRVLEQKLNSHTGLAPRRSWSCMRTSAAATEA
jgi:hypothetical protein